MRINPVTSALGISLRDQTQKTQLETNQTLMETRVRAAERADEQQASLEDSNKLQGAEKMQLILIRAASAFDHELLPPPPRDLFPTMCLTGRVVSVDLCKKAALIRLWDSVILEPERAVADDLRLCGDRNLKGLSEEILRPLNNWVHSFRPLLNFDALYKITVTKCSCV